MSINAAGIKLIKEFEGCKLTAYQDIVGVRTVGFGHTGLDVYAGMTITQDRADQLLASDLEKFGTQVSHLLVKTPSSNQFSALVCFAYNVGVHNLATSTLLRKFNEGLFAEAAEEFLKWDHAGGKVVPGLLRRRESEKALFLA